MKHQGILTTPFFVFFALFVVKIHPLRMAENDDPKQCPVAGEIHSPIPQAYPSGVETPLSFRLRLRRTGRGHVERHSIQTPEDCLHPRAIPVWTLPAGPSA